MSDKESHSQRDIEDVTDNFGLSLDMFKIALYSRQKLAEAFESSNQSDNESIKPPNGFLLTDAENAMFTDEGEFDKFTPEQACNLVNFFKQEFPKAPFFGREREHGNFEGIIDSLYQNAFETALYPTPMEKAAHLLYFVIKGHPFYKGNKRIATFLFCTFLEMHALGFIEKTIGYAAMRALVQSIVVSNSQDKKLVVNFVISQINRRKSVM